MKTVTSSPEILRIAQPDDWHLHLRDGDALALTVPTAAKTFARVIVMPNLKPPVTTVAQALAYRERILGTLQTSGIQAPNFQPLMTLYLTPAMTVDEIKKASATPDVAAVKLYPAGATTNSDAGVASLESSYPIFEAMQELDLPLLIHGESIESDIDVFDREARFIEQSLHPLVRAFPKLRVVFEHITTADAVSFVRESSSNIAATITPHHLLWNRNEIFRGGICPHAFVCRYSNAKPIVKRL